MSLEIMFRMGWKAEKKKEKGKAIQEAIQESQRKVLMIHFREK